MANEQHLRMIREAVEKHDIALWNTWRRDNPEALPDLSGADLRRSDLKHAAFRGAIFRDANLRGADFTDADLSGADLSEANLSRADLREANFSRARFLGALLLEADLDRANLGDGVQELSASQIKTARHWDAAYYCRDFLEKLGLPPDHNDHLPDHHAGPPAGE